MFNFFNKEVNHLKEELTDVKKERDAYKEAYERMKLQGSSGSSNSAVWAELAKALGLQISDNAASYLGSLITYFLVRRAK